MCVKQTLCSSTQTREIVLTLLSLGFYSLANQCTRPRSTHHLEGDKSNGRILITQKSQRSPSPQGATHVECRLSDLICSCDFGDIDL